MSVSLLPITIVPVKMFQENQYHIQISHSLIHYWNIDLHIPHMLNIGRRSIQITIEGASITKDELFLSDRLFQECCLPIQELDFVASYSKKEHSISLGPVIGLMTDLNDKGTEPDFRSIHAFCEELHEVVSNMGGLFYVFHFKDYEEGRLQGYCLQAGQWIKSEVPLPEVIYNRIHSRALEASTLFQSFKNSISTLFIHLFNDRFLSKKEVHNLLYSEEHMQPYLPETIMADEHSIKELLNKHKSLYLKPIHGSQGRNIIRITLNGEEILAELSSGNRKEETLLFENYTRFSQWFKQQKKKRIFLAQQAIPLQTYKNRQLDFRVLCHKNFQDTWKATSAVARISAEQQFVSNIARGGEIMKPLKIFSILSDQKTAIQQLALMKELAVETASIISQKCNGLIGELGIDIGVDKNGKLWIIEVNSKPSKNFEDSDKRIRPSAKALIEYAAALSFSGIPAKEDY
ncbi:YheC/YheD family endospore coat-associated protein [Cytobacillus oceanisediminis]|uniref:YheC/D-like protein n=1 Tax=Cytobacillus oceanisediminis TaxID=665099 RepID=A0A562JPY2_9BACI|nr:YheC/YheD family protein [Cytobacillus oceanisediminis]TWH85025.1 YheC/D-like protein [Cytobacillus oceanisediminis]